jgi:hypothetical protein
MNARTRAISIQQPWAELILQGRKTIELRTWFRDYQGFLWLHAGLAENLELEKHFQLTGLFRGGFIGVIHLDAIVPMTKERWELWRNRHQDMGSYQPNYYAWILSSPQRFTEPILSPGKPDLFVPDIEVVKKLLVAKVDKCS